MIDVFRKMRRFKQQLSEDRCIVILKTEKRGVLALNGDGGYPYTVPLSFVYEDGKIYFHSAVEGHKIDAITKDSRASFCVLCETEQDSDGWSYYVDSVVAFGKIAVITGEADRTDKLRKLGLKYFPTAEMVESDLQKNAARALVLALEIEHMTGKHVHER